MGRGTGVWRPYQVPCGGVRRNARRKRAADKGFRSRIISESATPPVSWKGSRACLYERKLLLQKGNWMCLARWGGGGGQRAPLKCHPLKIPKVHICDLTFQTSVGPYDLVKGSTPRAATMWVQPATCGFGDGGRNPVETVNEKGRRRNHDEPEMGCVTLT